MRLRDTVFRKLIIDSFTKLYYHARPRIWNNTFWFGIRVGKCPSDMWTYQEILFDVKPDVIIECGTGTGGSALFLAHHCDLIGKGRIISIDIADQADKRQHERIARIQGSSVADETLREIRRSLKDTDRVLVILDSDHTKQHVLHELNCYCGLVSVGSYIVVEDTIIGGHPVKPRRWPGPMEAIDEFLKTHSEFVIDKSREKFLLTFNRNGYLKRVR
jgi:cephalosporin hydroxylase